MFRKNSFLLFLSALLLLPGCMMKMPSPKKEFVRARFTCHGKGVREMEKIVEERVLRPMSIPPGYRSVMKTTTFGTTEMVFELAPGKQPGKSSLLCIRRLRDISEKLPAGMALTIPEKGN